MVKMNKKAQETSLLVWIVGIAAVVIIIIFLAGGFGFLGDIFNVAPGKALEVRLEACKLAVNTNNPTSFCRFDLIKVPGYSNEIYVNCEFSDLASGLAENPDVDTTALTEIKKSCVNSDVELCIRNYKDDMDKFTKIIINGKTCEKTNNGLEFGGVCDLDAKTCGNP
ncbi:hypothetical protein J4463_01115 [Candidatus Pacearchaeota archaeon]|nr:hypothetical protein [Candidatus Pacearchaeota archaeon]